MIRKLSRSQRHSPWTLVLGLLCLALVVLGSTIQVAHSHPSGDITHADCSLCATAHIVAQVAAAPAVLTVSFVVASVSTVASETRPSRLTVFALFTRPPPAVSTPA